MSRMTTFIAALIALIATAGFSPLQAQSSEPFECRYCQQIPPQQHHCIDESLGGAIDDVCTEYYDENEVLTHCNSYGDGEECDPDPWLIVPATLAAFGGLNRDIIAGPDVAALLDPEFTIKRHYTRDCQGRVVRRIYSPVRVSISRSTVSTITLSMTT